MKNLILLSSTLAMLLSGCGSSSNSSIAKLSNLSSGSTDPIIINTPGKIKTNQHTNQRKEQNKSIPKTALGAPSDLKIETISKNKIKLSWQDNSTKEKAFCIYKDNEHFATVEANKTSLEIASLVSGESHTFTIKAINNDGASKSVSIEGGVNILDLLKEISSYDTEADVLGLVISNDKTKAYVSTMFTGNVEVIDISDPSNPKKINSIDITLNENYIKDIVIFNNENQFYCSTYEDGLIFYDINTNEKKTLNIYGPHFILSKDKTKAYVADGSNGLVILDVSDPSNPKKISSFEMVDDAVNATISSDETKVFVADGDDGLVIIDVSDPSNPKKISSFETENDASNITLSNNETKAFVSNGSKGIIILDVSDPSNPKEIGSYDIANGVQNITISSDETKAFVVDGNDGLVILDISDLTDIKLIKRISIDSWAYKVTLSKDESKAFVSTQRGLVIIDIAALKWL